MTTPSPELVEAARQAFYNNQGGAGDDPFVLALETLEAQGWLRFAADLKVAAETTEHHRVYIRFGTTETTGGTALATIRKFSLRSEVLALKSDPAAAEVEPDAALFGIDEVMKESGGGWKPCSGCYDTEDGHPTRKYDFSNALQTDVGCGCHECGGLGAVWEYYSEADVAAMLEEFTGASAEKGV